MASQLSPVTSCWLTLGRPLPLSKALFPPAGE